MSVPVIRAALPLALLAALSLTTELAQAERSVSYTYTAQGQVETVDGPRSDVSDLTTYGYDAQGNRTSVTNALNQTTQTPEHDPAGRPLTVIDPNGLTTHLSYDPRGRLTEQRQSDGQTSRTTTYTYDPVGNLTRVTRDDGSYLSYTYDAAHRLTGLEDHLGNRIVYTLDLMGHTTREEVQDPQGHLTRLQQQVYDVLGQLRQQHDSQDQTTEYDYDPNGNLTQTQDANQHPTTQVYDPLDRLTESTDALQGVTDYDYDAQGNLVSVTDPTGLSTTYDYDGLGNLLSQSSPDTGTTTYTYDEAGNRLSQTDARGVTVHYTYDALNRLTAIDYPDNSRDITYTYDQGANGIGRLTQMSDGEGATEYAYNAYGDLIGQTRTGQDGVTTHFGYSYDSQGHLASLSYPSGHQIHYSYTQGQLTGLSLETPQGATQPLVSQIQRLPFGPIRALDYGNGLSLSRTYDQDYRLIAQSLPGVLEASYGHDPVGNIIDWQDLLQTTRDQQFGYDELDRLISASGAYGDLGYDYDAVGNRLSLTEGSDTETYHYVPDTHRLQEILGATPDSRQYDANGNTVESAQGSYTYDATNRMVSYTQGSTTATYAYNGKGERIRKDVNGAITRFRYAPTGQLLGEYDASGNPLREYVYLEGQPIAQITPQSAPAQLLQTVRANHQPQSVDLGQHPATPVIIASPLTYNGGQGAVVALDNLQSTQVNVWVKEWDYLDGGHASEEISLLALPPGRYPQADGSVWEIGRFELSGTRQWQSVNFSDAFAVTPDLFLTQQSQNDAQTTTVRARNVSASGFQAQLQEQESLNDGHAAETIGYLAIHSPSGGGQARFYGASLDYQLSQAQINHVWTAVGDQELQVQEEQSADSELGHAPETIAVLNLNGHTFAQDVSTNGGDTSALRRRGASSEIAISGTPGSGLAYLHTDHLGTVVKATDQAQNVVWDAVRMPFGERTVEVAEVAVLLGFPGQYYDQESGNFYNYFRDYDPTAGRYLQSDPIGLDGGLNTYSYVGGNPLRYTDPTGEFAGVLFNPTTLGAIGITAIWMYMNPDAAQSLWDAMHNESGESDSDLQDEIERGANHQEYKNYCDNNTPPPGMDKCDEMLWHINRLEKCVTLREAFDRKWGTNHGPQIDQKRVELDKWKRRHENAWDCQMKRCFQ